MFCGNIAQSSLSDIAQSIIVRPRSICHCQTSINLSLSDTAQSSLSLSIKHHLNVTYVNLTFLSKFDDFKTTTKIAVVILGFLQATRIN